jgi:hypothetical protein
MVPHVGQSRLPGRTLTWLLESSNPSARYLTLTRILGRDEDAPEVRASRAAIPEAAPARDILRAQYPQGYWMHPGIGHSPRYRATVWQILILAQLGMARSERLDRAVEHLFGVNQREDGAFRASKEPGDTPISLNGSLLWALETLGYGDLLEVRRAWSWLLSELQPYYLSRKNHSGATSPRGWVKVLWAANALSSHRRDTAVERVRRAAAASLLDRLPDRAGADAHWSQLTFPLTQGSDLLQWVEELVGAEYGDHPRLNVARAWLARKRCPGGAWPLERVPGKLWADVGELHEPNKWITVRALAVRLQPGPRLRR